MATQLFFRSTVADYGTGHNDLKLNGVASGWLNRNLALTRGSGVVVLNTTTVAGPTNGIEPGAATSPTVWYSPPLDAAVTISGSVTWNLWAAEGATAANVAINGVLEVIDGATGAITNIDTTARTTEVAITTRSANNFAETPAAGVLCKRGDRLRVRVFGDDSAAGNMGVGSYSFGHDGGTVAADGDSYLTLTENLTFASEPAGTTIYPTNTASDVSTASVDREAWTSRGAGVQNDITNTVTGFTPAIQMTDTAGGIVADWFTRPLQAVTLGGAVRVNIRSAVGANTGVGVEIARVAYDGTNATVWAKGFYPASGSPEAARSILASGTDLAISHGQRLRIRYFIDDASNAAMVGGSSATFYYAGTSGGASGDTYLTFTQSLSAIATTSASATQATATGAAIGSSSSAQTNANVATGSGAVQGSTTDIATTAGEASGTGTAYGAIAATTAPVDLNAGVALASGTANGVRPGIGVFAGLASATAAAWGLVTAVEALAGVATGTIAAWAANPIGALLPENIEAVVTQTGIYASVEAERTLGATVVTSDGLSAHVEI